MTPGATLHSISSTLTACLDDSDAVLAVGVSAGSLGLLGSFGAQPARPTANISASMVAARCFMAFPFFPPCATSARRRVGPTGRPRWQFGLPSFRYGF